MLIHTKDTTECAVKIVFRREKRNLLLGLDGSSDLGNFGFNSFNLVFKSRRDKELLGEGGLEGRL